MKASELIKSLQDIVSNEGDVDVSVGACDYNICIVKHDKRKYRLL